MGEVFSKVCTKAGLQDLVLGPQFADSRVRLRTLFLYTKFMSNICGTPEIKSLIWI